MEKSRTACPIDGIPIPVVQRKRLKDIIDTRTSVGSSLLPRISSNKTNITSSTANAPMTDRPTDLDTLLMTKRLGTIDFDTLRISSLDDMVIASSSKTVLTPKRRPKTMANLKSSSSTAKFNGQNVSSSLSFGVEGKGFSQK